MFFFFLNEKMKSFKRNKNCRHFEKPLNGRPCQSVIDWKAFNFQALFKLYRFPFSLETKTKENCLIIDIRVL